MQNITRVSVDMRDITSGNAGPQWHADGEFCPRLMVGAVLRELPVIRRLVAGANHAARP
jgi:hypothetical protein